LKELDNVATVISNDRLTDGVYHLRVEANSGGEMGQFYMLRAWGAYPLLSRPLSIHQVNDDGVEFLYHVVGEGTEILSRLNPGDSVGLEGPFGTGFPQVEGKVALVGGGIGIAPLYYCAKELPGSGTHCTLDRLRFRRPSGSQGTGRHWFYSLLLQQRDPYVAQPLALDEDHRQTHDHIW